MRSIEQLLTQYAAYHRDRRNIATHFVGVPVIVFSVVLALSAWPIGAVHAGWIGIAAASLYYLILNRPLGLAMLVFLTGCGLLSSMFVARAGPGMALALAAVLFIGGWIVQFVGHKFEGMKPAFVDDLVGLLVGPLFVTAELCFALGALRDLQHYIEDRVGPTLAARNGAPIGPRGSHDPATHGA